MLFGLALFAGLVGYAFVDPFGNGEDSVDVDSGDDLNAFDTVVSDESSLFDLAADIPEAGAADTDTDATGLGAEIMERPAPDMGETVVENIGVTETVNAGATIEGTDGDDLIYGGNANDVIFGGDGNYTMNGGSGDDQLRGGDGSNTINGEDGDDRLFAGEGNVDRSSNTLNGGEGNDTLYGTNEPQNLLNGEAGDDEIHLRGRDIATGGEGADSFRSSTEYSNGEVSTITDYNAEEDLIIVEYTTGFVNGGALNEPEVSININGDDAVICMDGEECIVVQGAASSLTIGDILLQPTL